MKKIISSKIVRAIAPISMAAALIVPEIAMATIAGNMNDGAIQGMFWGSLALNKDKYKSEISGVKKETSHSAEKVGKAETASPQKDKANELIESLEHTLDSTK
jgi:hypothetical protein